MEKRETEPEKKMNQMGGWGGFYIAIFPMVLPTEINCCRWH
jgi:hypothetical protein